MAGGVDFKWFQDQQQGIQLLATQPAKRANREGLPNHDTPRRLRRRAKYRAMRYELETEGLGVFLKRRLLRQSSPVEEAETARESSAQERTGQ